MNLELSSSVTRPKASSTDKTDKDEYSLDNQKKLYNDRYKKDTKWRCRLSWWVIIVDSAWLLAILIILFLNTHFLELSDPVLLMLLGTTTINVLGLAFIILKGFFGNSETSKNKQQ